MKWFRFVLIAIGLLVVIGCSSKEDELVGSWETSFGHRSGFPTTIKLELRPDGTGVYENSRVGISSSEDFTWEVSGDELCVNLTASVTTNCREYEVVADYLDYELFRQPLEFKRLSDN